METVVRVCLSYHSLTYPLDRFYTTRPEIPEVRLGITITYCGAIYNNPTLAPPHGMVYAY